MRSRTNRVSNWQGKDQASRWEASSLVIQEKKFRRINGTDHLAILIRALEMAPVKNVEEPVEIS